MATGKPPSQPNGGLTKADYETLASLRHTLRLFLRFSEDAAAAEGLSPQQHQALLAIKGFPGREQVTIGELADKLQLRHHSVVGLVDRLEAERMVVRTPADDDRRKVLVSLTARGQGVLEKLSFAHREEFRRFGPGFRALLEQLSVP